MICAQVKAAFDASPLFTLKKLKNKICRRQVPFNLHAVYEFKPSSNDVSILVEIQIHDSEVRKASAAQQRFYQIFRAVSSEKLHKVEAHHTMTHSKLMKQRSQPAWKSTRELGYCVDIHEPPRHREPTRSRGQRRVDDLETPRHRADAATETTSRRRRGAPEILFPHRSQRHMLRTAKISSSRALKALHRNFSIRNTGRRLCINQILAACP